MQSNHHLNDLPDIEQKNERERILAQVALRIRQSLELETILNTTVAEVRSLLGCDRVLVYRFLPNWEGNIVAESVAPEQTPTLGSQIADRFFQDTQGRTYIGGNIQAISDIDRASLSDYHLQLLKHFDVKANLVIPILMNRDSSVSSEPPESLNSSSHLWGLLVAHQCTQTRQWQSIEIDFLERLAVQIAIAIQQAELYHQIKAELVQRQRTEATLRSSEQQYRRLFDCNPNPMWVYDCETFGFLAVNQAAVSHYGYSRDEFLSMTILDLRPVEDIASAIATVYRVSQQRYSNSGIVKQHKKDGTAIDVELTSNAITWSGRPARIVMGKDITQRLQAEKALRESERRYATLADASPVGLFRIDDQGYSIYGNQRAYEILGLSAEKAMTQGWEWEKSLHPEDRDRVLTEWERTLQENIPFRSEYRFVRPDGEIIWVFAQGVAEVRDDGKTIGYVGTISDITDRIRAQQDLQNLNEQLEQRVFERTTELANSVARLEREIAKRERAQREQHLLTERLQYLLASSSTLIYSYQSQNQPTFISDNFRSILGYEPKECLENPNFWRDRIHPEDLPHFLNQQPTLFDNNRLICEYRFLHTDGTYHWLRDEARVVRDATGSILEIVGSAIDITDRKQAEIALRHSEARFHKMAANVPGMLYQYQLQTDGTEGFMYVSSVCWEIFEIDVETVNRDRSCLWSTVHSDFLLSLKKAIAASSQSLEPLQWEGRIVTPSGCHKWVQAFARPERQPNGDIVWDGVLIDISDRKHTEQALQHSQERFRSVVANIPGAIYRQLCLPQQWMMELMGDPIAEISGYPPQDFIFNSRRSYTSIIHPEDRDRVMRTLHAAMSVNAPFEMEYRIQRSDGNIIWIFDKGNVIFNDKGEPLWIDGAIFDITDRKVAEAKLEQRNRYSSAILAAQRQLLVAPSDPFLYAKILKIVGPASNASRVYIFENHYDTEGQLLTSQKAEWCAPGIPPEIGSPATQNICYEQSFPGWTEILSKGDFIQGIVAELSDSMREILEPQGIQSILILPLIVKGQFFGVIGFDNCVEARAWERIEVDLLNSVAGAIALAKERHLMQESLQRLGAAVEAATDGIAIFNDRNEFIYVNSAYLCLFGYSIDEPLLGKIWHHLLYYPNECERFETEVFPQLIQLGYWRGEATGKKFDGSTFAQEVSLTLIANGGIICVCRDISRRKQAEAQIQASLREKEVLLKEIHHRVKNNLQIIQSLLRLQSNYTQDSRAIQIFHDSQNRIRSMALIHELLYRSSNLSSIDFAEYIENLTSSLSRAYDANSQSVTVSVNAEPIQLSIDTALPCGLIINELIANALKYAFPNGRSGAIAVEFFVNTNDRFTLMVRDNGVGFPKALDFRNTESLGLQLVCDSTEQLEGIIHLDRTNGTTFVIEFTESKYTPRT